MLLANLLPYISKWVKTHTPLLFNYHGAGTRWGKLISFEDEDQNFNLTKKQTCADFVVTQRQGDLKHGREEQSSRTSFLWTLKLLCLFSNW